LIEKKLKREAKERLSGARMPFLFSIWKVGRKPPSKTLIALIEPYDRL
jgi:hypothetical protein